MDYSRVSVNDQAGRVLSKLRDDIAGEQARIWAALDATLADPTTPRAEKIIATYQHQAAYDALMWAFRQTDRYFTPISDEAHS